MVRVAGRAVPLPDIQREFGFAGHKIPADSAFLRSILRRHQYDSLIIQLRLILQFSQECAPACIADRQGKLMVPLQVSHLKVFGRDQVLVLDFTLGKVKYLKGHSAKIFFQRHPEIRNHDFWGGHLWSHSYYMSTLGNMSREIVEKYIRNQNTK